MNKLKIKYIAIKIIVIAGISYLLCAFWWLLEILLDGGIHQDNSDTVIALIIILMLTDKFIKWIVKS